MMLLNQVFKTAEGAHKRAAFENAHCNGRYWYSTVRCLDGAVDTTFPDQAKWSRYTWRIKRETRAQRKEQGFAR